MKNLIYIILILSLNLFSQYEWSTPLKLSGNGTYPGNFYSDTAIVLDHNNTIYAFWINHIETGKFEWYSQIELRKSYDLGITWSPIENITPEITTGRAFKIEAVCDSLNNIHIVYQYYSSCVYKKFDGVSWSQPIVISNNLYSTLRLGIDNSDLLYATWYCLGYSCFSYCDARADSIKWSEYEKISDENNFIYSNYVFDSDNSLYAGGSNADTNKPCFFKYDKTLKKWSYDVICDNPFWPTGLILINDEIFYSVVTAAIPYSSDSGTFLISKSFNDSLWSSQIRINDNDYRELKSFHYDSERNLHLFESYNYDYIYSKMLSSTQEWFCNTVQSDLNYIYDNERVYFDKRSNMFYSIHEKYEISTNNSWIYFQSKLNETGIESDNVLPLATELYQNYPNPFNPATNIKFSLSKSGKVELSVYNIAGQLVRRLVDKEMSAGFHSVKFEADNLNSGMYFYKLKANGKELTKKMLMVK